MRKPPGNLIRLGRSQLDRASAMLTWAFFEDPKLAYIILDPSARQTLGKELLGFELRYGMKYGEVYATSPELEGIAVWLPSKYAQITTWRAILSGALRLRKAIGVNRMERLMKFSDFLDTSHARHAPYPHSYLFFVGVSPAHQGKGFASKLIRPVLDRLDGTATSCYLATQNPGNVPMYEHFGFSVVERTKIPGSDVAHIAMVRLPKEHH